MLADGDPVDLLFGLKETCALDVAARGGATFDEVGEWLLLSRERVRQIEEIALLRVRLRLARRSGAERRPTGLVEAAGEMPLRRRRRRRRRRCSGCGSLRHDLRLCERVAS